MGGITALANSMAVGETELESCSTKDQNVSPTIVTSALCNGTLEETSSLQMRANVEDSIPPPFKPYAVWRAMTGTKAETAASLVSLMSNGTVAVTKAPDTAFEGESEAKKWNKAIL